MGSSQNKQQKHPSFTAVVKSMVTALGISEEEATLALEEMAEQILKENAADVLNADEPFTQEPS